MTSLDSTAAASPAGRMLAQSWYLVLLRGLLGVAFGLLALLFPVPTVLSLVIIFAAYMLLDGASSAVATYRAVQEHKQWGWLLAQSIASVAAAAVVIAWPGISVLVFVLLTAAWAIVSGCLMLAGSYAMHEKGRWWLAVGGIGSLIYGVLMAILPPIGVLVLIWWIAAYAFVFGVSLIVLAFNLRKGKALLNEGTSRANA